MPNVKQPSPLIGNARSNRQQMIEGEVRIWTELRRKAIGVRFRRQHPIGPYIVDFASLTLKLIIEIDGSQHYGWVRADSTRDHYLTSRGWTVLRFSSYDAVANTPAVVETILDTIRQLEFQTAPPNPSPNRSIWDSPARRITSPRWRSTLPSCGPRAPLRHQLTFLFMRSVPRTERANLFAAP